MLRWLALAVGVALLVWRVRAVGLDTILAGFAALGWRGFLLVLALSLPRFGSRAGAWMVLLGGGLSFRRGLAATIAGDAAGNLTPLGPIVGEPTKVAYAAADTGSARALAALAAENFFYGVSVAMYVSLGAAAMLQAFPVSDTVRQVGIGAIVAMSAVLAGAGWTAWRQPTLLSAVVSRLPFAGARAVLGRVRDFEVSTYGSTGGRGDRLVRVIALHAAFHALSFAEMWLTLWLLTGESLPGAALVLDAFGRIANLVFKVVPLQLGVHQVGSEIVAQAIGLDPSLGLMSSFVRTVRVLAWMSVGLVLLGRRGLRH